MEAKSLMMLRVLLNHYHKGSSESFLNCLPQEEIRNVLTQDIESHDIQKGIARPGERLQNIHYSWLLNPIEQMSSSLQSYVISALPESQAKGIERLLQISHQQLPLSQPVKVFFLNVLYSRLQASSVIPIPFLPKTPLTFLANLGKQEVVELMDFLAMHDLVQEVRQIVDKARLKLLYACLSKKHQQYLRIVLHQQDKIIVPKLGLDKWDGNCKFLETEIHRRGIIRLGKALSGQHPDLIWHISHTLDTGRSAILLKNCTKEAIPGTTSALVSQVINVLNFLKQTQKEIT